MKQKPLLITIGVLLLLAAIVAGLNRTPSSSTHIRKSGLPLIEPSRIEGFARVVLEGKASRTELVIKGKDAFTTRDSVVFPADTDRLKALFEALSGVRYDRFVSDKPETRTRLNIGTEKLSLFSADGKPLFVLHKGDSNGDRFYFSTGDDVRIYQARGYLYMDTAADSWLDYTPVTLAEPEISRLDVTFADNSTAAFTRPNDSSPWALEGASSGETLDTGVLDSLRGQLAGLRFSRTVARTDSEFTAAATHIKAKVKLTDAQKRSQELTFYREPASGDASAPKKKPFLVIGPAEGAWKNAFEAFAFEVVDAVIDSIPASRDAFLEKPEPLPEAALPASGATDVDQMLPQLPHIPKAPEAPVEATTPAGVPAPATEPSATAPASAE